MSNEHERQWAERLEAGAEDDELLALAARLRRAGETTRATPPLAFQQQLRRDLLNQAAAPRHGANVWRWVGSLAAVALLAVVVGLTWLSISSAGRPSFGGRPSSASSTNANSGEDSALPTNRLVDYSVNGGVVTETTATEDSGTQTTYLLVPGMTATVSTRWSLATPSIELQAFVHLLDEQNQVVAQGDARLEPAVDGVDQAQYVATIPVTLPAEVPPGTYQLVSGLYDPTTGVRQSLSFNGSEVMTVTLGHYTVAASSPANGFDVQQLFDDLHRVEHAQLAEAQEDTLLLHEVSPAAGTEISGTAPIEFVVSVDYALVSLPQAILEVRVVEQTGEDGRGIGLATTEIVAGTGTATVVVLVNPSELPQAADLGLWLQLKPDEASPPTLIKIPEGVGWFYVP